VVRLVAIIGAARTVAAKEAKVEVESAAVANIAVDPAAVHVAVAQATGAATGPRRSNWIS
jgi:hypothetical protein